jgi:hypothetical protein
MFGIGSNEIKINIDENKEYKLKKDSRGYCEYLTDFNDKKTNSAILNFNSYLSDILPICVKKNILNKNNIEKIILKSLKFNFNLTELNDVKAFIDQKIIDKFFSSQVTGAHIYNSVSMMKLKYDMIIKSGKKNFEITTTWLLDEIDAEIKILDKIKAQQKINDRLNNSGAIKQIGFGNSDDYVEIEELEIEELICYPDEECCECDGDDSKSPICPR